MSKPSYVVELSRPSFAELSSRLIAAGHTKALCDTGEICVGDLHIAAVDRTSKARVAHQIAEAAAIGPDPDVLFENAQIRISVRCTETRLNLIVHSIVNAKTESVSIPRECGTMVAAGILDCLMSGTR